MNNKTTTMKFTTMGNAKKITGLSYLGSVASSSKIAKGLKYNEMTYILYLAPASLSGYNVCPMSTEECRTACLTESGHNRIDVKKNAINKARIKKTKLFFEHREFFMSWLVTEIEKAKSKADELGYRFSVRLNGTSDIEPTRFQHNGMVLFELFDDVQFYDYTKHPSRKLEGKTVGNYDLTFSFSSITPKPISIKGLTNPNNSRVAVVFQKKEDIPLSFRSWEVIDGDDTDVRHIEPKNVVVALYAKGKAKKDHSGFVQIKGVHYA